MRLPIARSEAGFTLVESLVAATIMTLLGGAVLQLLLPAQATFQAQLESSDMQQRLRVGVAALERDLSGAGAGPLAAQRGPLLDVVAPVMPYRRGETGDDPSRGVLYRQDTISVLAATAGDLGRLAPDTRVMVTDGQRWRPTRLDALGIVGGDEAAFPIESHTYFLQWNATGGDAQLMHYDGQLTSAPVIDHVVGLEFDYLGDPQPPRLRPESGIGASAPRVTTYGPRPPALDVDFDPRDEYPRGENCTFARRDEVQVERLPMLAAGRGLVTLPPALLADGPWCPGAGAVHRFDADLLRIRRVRVRLRVEAAHDALRGPAGVLFTRAGTSSGSQLLPDQSMELEITPRNLNAGR